MTSQGKAWGHLLHNWQHLQWSIHSIKQDYKHSHWNVPWSPRLCQSTGEGAVCCLYSSIVPRSHGGIIPWGLDDDRMVPWNLSDQKTLRGRDYVELFTCLPRNGEKQCKGMRRDDIMLDLQASRQLLSKPHSGLALECLISLEQDLWHE